LKPKQKDSKELVIGNKAMDKFLKGENIKDVLPGQKSNIPLQSGTVKAPTKVLDKAPAKTSPVKPIETLKSKILDTKPMIKDLQSKIDEKKAVIDKLTKEVKEHETDKRTGSTVKGTIVMDIPVRDAPVKDVVGRDGAVNKRDASR